MLISHHIFLVLAAVCFLIDIFNVPVGVKMVSLGLLCLTCSWLFL